MSSTPILECSGVGKRYGRKRVLDKISFSLRKGEVFGFLGPNGAGKTTLIKIFIGLVTPGEGEITVFGHNLFTHRRQIMREVGAIVEAPVFTASLTAYANLHALVSLNGPVEGKRIDEVLELVGLADVARQKVGTFSYGMKQRLGIAQALLPRNRLVFLDEPTNGLDPHGIAGMRRLIHRLSKDMGITVFVSSHLLQEIEQVCDRVMIIDRGQTVLAGDVAEIIGAEAKVVDIEIELGAGTPATVAACGGTAGNAPFADGAERGIFTFAVDSHSTPDLIQSLVEAGERVLAVRPRCASLEDVFIRQTGEGGRNVRSDAF